jgi:hypothetical protein
MRTVDSHKGSFPVAAPTFGLVRRAEASLVKAPSPKGTARMGQSSGHLAEVSSRKATVLLVAMLKVIRTVLSPKVSLTVVTFERDRKVPSRKDTSVP